jgi:hypothetical protein
MRRTNIQTQRSPPSNPGGFILGGESSTLLEFAYYLLKMNGGHPIGMCPDRNRQCRAARILFSDVSEIYQLF